MKRGYLGPLEIAYLAGRSAGLQEILEERGVTMPAEIIPVDRMIYVAAFQGGIEQFLSPLRPSFDQHADQFISSRLREPKNSNTELFEALMVIKPKNLTEKEEIVAYKALSFIHDLIVSMENNASVINVSGIPAAGEIKGVFRPDVAFSICTILSSLESVATGESLPSPSRVVNAEVVERFRELLASDVYARYANAHQEIEFSSGRMALENVRKRGGELMAAGRGVLRSQPVSVNILSFVPKVVDAAFGKLPGALAQVAGDLATRFLTEKRNLVVYEFDGWVKEYGKASIGHAMRNRSE